VLSKQVSNKCIAVLKVATGTHVPYGNTQCYLPPDRGDIPALPQPKLVLDLATQEGCKVELT